MMPKYSTSGVMLTAIMLTMSERLRTIDKAIQLNSIDLKVLQGIAVLAYFELRDYDAAIGDFDRALELDPNQPYTYYQSGQNSLF